MLGHLSRSIEIETPGAGVHNDGSGACGGSSLEDEDIRLVEAPQSTNKVRLALDPKVFYFGHIWHKYTTMTDRKQAGL